MKAEYERLLTIAAVGLVIMYVLANFSGTDMAARFGLTPVA